MGEIKSNSAVILQPNAKMAGRYEYTPEQKEVIARFIDKMINYRKEGKTDSELYSYMKSEAASDLKDIFKGVSFDDMFDLMFNIMSDVLLAENQQ